MIMGPPLHVPPLVDDLVEEILIRCSPDNPEVLVRAAAVCNDWRRVVSGAGFRRRFREHHCTAPMLGFLHYGRTPFRFEPTTSFRPRYTGARVGVELALDARHGCVLFSSFSSGEILVVWDLVSGDAQELPMPRLHRTCRRWSAAVLCAAARCDHLDCARGPFRVVFVGINNVQAASVCACIYSSVEGEWSEPTSRPHHSTVDLMGKGPGALVGNAFYFLFRRGTGIVEFDLGTGEVSVIDLDIFHNPKMIVLTAAEEFEGQLGLAFVTYYGSRLVVWTREASRARDSAGQLFWVQTRVIELKPLLPAETFLVSTKVVGLADGVGVVIVQTHDGGLFTIDIKSSHVRKIGNGLSRHDVIAYMNFHTPASSGVGPDCAVQLHQKLTEQNSDKV